MTPWIRIRKNRSPRVACPWEVFAFQPGIDWQLTTACASWASAQQTARRAIRDHWGHCHPEPPC